MTFLLQIVRLFVVMLFSALGASMAFAVPINTSEISFYQTENTLLSQSTDVGFAARAPPLAMSNVATTGDVTVMHGGAFALRGQETVVVLFSFDRSTIATNTGVNLNVRSLGDVPDPALNPTSMRRVIGGNLRNSVDPNDVSVATASVTVNGRTEYFVSVSGKSYSGTATDTITMNGRTYNVVRSDSGSVASAPNGSQTNANHAEQKLFSHIQDNYGGQNVNVNVAVQNTSSSSPGMCQRCSTTSNTFAAENPNFNINVFEGSTGVRP